MEKQNKIEVWNLQLKTMQPMFKTDSTFIMTANSFEIPPQLITATGFEELCSIVWHNTRIKVTTDAAERVTNIEFAQ